VSDAPTGTIAVLATHSKWQDGSYLESGGLDYPTDIYVVDVVRRRVRNLTRDERSEFCWSWVRRGRGIVFASVPNDRMKPGPATIDVVTANGRRRRRLVSSEGVLCPTLSPDGRRISFVVERGRQRGLYVTRIDGTHKKRLTRSLESPRATWSPDGKQILFLREFRRVRGSDIYVINADGTGLRRLTRTKRDREQPAWSPDGQNIAFIRSVGLWSLLFTMRRDGTNVKRLMRTTASASSPTSISNGRVAWQVNRNRERWWAADASGATAPRPLPLPTRRAEPPLPPLYERPDETACPRARRQLRSRLP